MSPALAEFQDALQTHHPLVSLRQVAITYLERGGSREQLLQLLEELRAEYRAEGNSRGEDFVLDTMDFAVGWCSPHMKIPNVA